MLSIRRMLIYLYIFLNISGYSEEQITQDSLRHLSKCKANFTLAGFFTLHHQISANEACSKGRLSMRSLFRAIAMVYTVSKINNDQSLLPGITLGVDMKDICHSLDVAIHSYLGLDFVGNIHQTGWSHLHDELNPGPTFAVIGTGTTTTANSLSTLSNQFDVPVISFSATSPLLSNKDRFKSFFRTVPNDDLLADMVYDLLEKLNWNLVSVIHSETDYGFTALAAFKSKLQKAGKSRQRKSQICLGFVARFKTEESGTDGTFDVANSEFDKSNVVVVFAHSQDTKKILECALKLKIKGKVWILTDMSPTEKTFCDEKWESFFGRIIIIAFKSYQDPMFIDFVIKNIIERKDSILRQILPEINEIRGRFKDHVYNDITVDVPSNINYVVDAVNAAANALHVALKCNKKECLPVETFKQSNLLSSLYEVNFTSQLGHEVSFDQNGDTGGIYVLHVLSPMAGRKCKFEKFGEWRSFGSKKGFTELDKSISERHKSSCTSCAEGWGRLPIEAGSCCWTCERCDGDEYKSNTTKLCEKCPTNSIPDSRHSQCIMLTKRYASFTSSNSGIAILCMCITGLLLVLVILCILYKYRNTHLVRASSKEVTAVLLLGIAIGFATPLFAVTVQNTWTCQLYVYINGLSFSIMIGALFTRVNRISRIFRKQVMRTGKLNFMSLKWQMLFISIFVIVELSMQTIVVFYPGDKVRSIAVKNGHYIDIYCHINSQMLVGLMSFNGVLVLLCTYQAFLSRKLPSEYRESQSIFIVMLLITLQIIAIIVTLGFGGGDFNPVLLSIPDYLDAAIITAILFGFKLYVILFKPDQNKVQNPHGSLGKFLSTKRKRRRTLNPAEPVNDSGNGNTQPAANIGNPAVPAIRTTQPPANIGIQNASYEGN